MSTTTDDIQPPKPEVNKTPDVQTKTVPVNSGQESRLLSGPRLWVVMGSLMLSMFLVALDAMIVAPAVPAISSRFNALNELTWIVSAFFLTQSGSVMPAGQILMVVPAKYVCLGAVSLFEVGSLLCATSPNMNALIAGRALQGAGAGTLLVAILSLISQVTTLEQRPLFIGMFGGLFGIASIVGPVLGGVFTDQLSWRWCFYINLPIGGVAMIALIIFLPVHPALVPERLKSKTTLEKVLALDWLGTALSLALTVSLLLPLFWGGNERPWNDPAVIALFVVAGVVLSLLAAWEWYTSKPDSNVIPLIPIHILKSRNVIGVCIMSACAIACLNMPAYYLPLFYQAAKARSAQQSGLDIIPLVVSGVVTMIITGAITRRTGEYWMWLVPGSCITAVGGGLLYTIKADTAMGRIAGYQILAGVGIGLTFQNPNLALQAEFVHNLGLLAQAMAISSYVQRLGSVFGVSIAGTVFANQLASRLSKVTDLSGEMADYVKKSVTALDQLSPTQRTQVVQAYVSALDASLLVIVPFAVVGLASVALIRRYNLKTHGAAQTVQTEKEVAV